MSLFCVFDLLIVILVCYMWYRAIGVLKILQQQVQSWILAWWVFILWLCFSYFVLVITCEEFSFELCSRIFLNIGIWFALEFWCRGFIFKWYTWLLIATFLVKLQKVLEFRNLLCFRILKFWFWFILLSVLGWMVFRNLIMFE